MNQAVQLQTTLSQRVIIIGSGPVGVRFANELLKRAPMASVQLFGNEAALPYNRIQLSAFLVGDVSRSDIDMPMPNPDRHPNFSFAIAAIRKVDRENKTVTDLQGHEYPYDVLVFATGARAHVPHIPGVEQKGVYTFRNLRDAEALYARNTRCRHLVVVGGGLLGIEAARGMLRHGTLVTLIQQGPHLMNRQLDPIAAQLMQEKVEALGIRVIVNDGVREIFGRGTGITGVRTHSDEMIDCDTVLLCAGIKPNVELARAARLKVTNGILVSDQLQSSDESIYAIGECCEHRGLTYGLVNPGYEQAAIAADTIAKGQSHYVGSLTLSRLKVVGESVCSMGEVVDLPQRRFQKEIIYHDKEQGLYRKLVLLRGRLIGAIAYGEWAELNRIQEAFQQQRYFYPWQQWLFRLTGKLWLSSDSADIKQWPADALVCQCNSIPLGELTAACDMGCKTLSDLKNATGAGTVCGSCTPLLSQLFEEAGPREKEKGAGMLLSGGVLALLLVTIFLLIPEQQVADSVQTKGWFESIWNDKFWKQVTGFTLLGLSAVGLLMSLRKRLKWQWMGRFSGWRVAHAVLGVMCAILVMVHTGFHSGSHLNQWLLIDFLAVLVMGALAGTVIAFSHRLSAANANSVRKTWTWFHVLVTWPLPALLAAHILTVYYF